MIALLAVGLGLVADDAGTPPPRWGEQGHRIVCEIAWQRLTPAGRQLVGRLMEDGHTGFVASCSWADAARSSTHPYTAPYHFVNIPAGSSGFDMSRDCGPSAGGCVTWAIGHYGMALQDGEDRVQRGVALRFLSHFVADLHQPLHAGHTVDLGGGRLEVRIELSPCAESANLHALWDVVVLCHGGLEWRQGADALAGAVTAAQAAAWSNLDVVGWTNESFRLAEDFAYRISGERMVDRAYLTRAVSIVREQLQRAGVRLAFLINRAAVGGLDFGFDTN